MRWQDKTIELAQEVGNVVTRAGEPRSVKGIAFAQDAFDFASQGAFADED